ncbi:MAG: hypothetical protein ABWY19_09840, partial [Marmoricola sp.]
PLSVRRKRAIAGALVLAVSGVGATGLSAAANTLPRPIQHRVHEFSKHYLPFDLPEPPPPGQPLGADVLPPVPSAEPRPGDPEASRSAQQRAGVPTGPDAAARPAQVHAYTTGPDAAPSPSAYAQPAPSSAPLASPSGGPSPSSAPSPSASPGSSDSSAGSGGHDGRPTKTSTKGPRKDETKHGTDTSDATAGGQGPGTDAKPGGGESPAPSGGADPTPTVPDPSEPSTPDPIIIVPLPDPLPDLGLLPQTDASPQTDGG